MIAYESVDTAEFDRSLKVVDGPKLVRISAKLERIFLTTSMNEEL